MLSHVQLLACRHVLETERAALGFQKKQPKTLWGRWYAQLLILFHGTRVLQPTRKISRDAWSQRQPALRKFEFHEWMINLNKTLCIISMSSIMLQRTGCIDDITGGSPVLNLETQRTYHLQWLRRWQQYSIGLGTMKPRDDQPASKCAQKAKQNIFCATSK